MLPEELSFSRRTVNCPHWTFQTIRVLKVCFFRALGFFEEPRLPISFNCLHLFRTDFQIFESVTSPCKNAFIVLMSPFLSYMWVTPGTLLLSFLTFPSPGTTSTTSIPRDYACGTNNVYVLVVPVRRYGAFQEVLSWRVEPNYSYGPLERLIACQYPITLIKGWVGAAALSKEQGCALTLLTCLFLDGNKGLLAIQANSSSESGWLQARQRSSLKPSSS